jgi:hypothetical protein
MKMGAWKTTSKGTPTEKYNKHKCDIKYFEYYFESHTLGCYQVNVDQ